MTEVLQEALGMSKGTHSDEREIEGEDANCSKWNVNGDRSGGEEGVVTTMTDDDEEDDTAELLEKIKCERAAEQAPVERVKAEATEAEETRFATANPFLNLAGALAIRQE